MTTTAEALPGYDRWLVRRARAAVGPAAFYLFVAMFVFAVLAPFAWMLISSISPQTELTNAPPDWIPEHPTLFRYEALFFGPQPGQSIPGSAAKFLAALANSLIISA